MTTVGSTQRNLKLCCTALALGALLPASVATDANAAPNKAAAKPAAKAEAKADTKSEANAEANAAAAPRDVVMLKNGSSVRGWVARYSPASHVIVKTETASVTIAAAEVVSVAFADRGPETGTEVAARLLAQNANAGNSAAPAGTASTAATAPVAVAAVAMPAAKSAVTGTAAAAPTAAARPSINLLPTAARTTAAPATSTPGSTPPAVAPRGAAANTTTERAWLSTKQGTVGHSTSGPAGTLTHQADLKRASASREQVSADGRERSRTELSGVTKSVSHSSTSNCATPGDPNCSNTAGVSLGADGLGAEVSQTHVTRVKTPPPGYLVFQLDAGIVGIAGENIRALMGAGSFGLRGAIGGQLPGSSGGGWSGLGVDASASIATGQAEVTIDYGSYTETAKADYTQGSAGVALGWQYLHFGKLDTASLEQNGFGFFLGYRAGVNKDLNSDQAPAALSHGPQLALSFPKYNAGTAGVSDMTLKAMVLPTGDITVFALSFGFGF